MPISIGFVADICGIVGLIFSIGIWFATKDLKGQINVYKRAQKSIITTLMANRDNIIRDNLYTMDIRSNLRTELYSILQSYGALLSPIEKLKIRWAIHLLKKSGTSAINREKLCSLLDYIIARFQKKETR